MLPVVKGNLETLAQAKDILNVISDTVYQHIPAPYAQSSIGQHFRHIIDNYLALQQGVEINHVDYNWRRRGAQVESCPQTARDELDAITNWLTQINEKTIEEKLTLVSEVCLEQTQSDFATSSLQRELIFVASHAIHHIAIISMCMKLQDVTVPNHIGLAPATASFLRQQCTKKTA